MKMLTDHSYGIIPVQKSASEWQVLLIQHGTANYWGFPKGHADGDETPKQAAVRELREETNLEVVNFLSETILEEHYKFTWRGKLIAKTVWFFVAQVAGDLQLQAEEVKSSRWVPLANACDHLTYDTDKSICRQAATLINACFG